MSRFITHQTPIAGLMEIERLRIGDDRGFLSRVFCSEDFSDFGWTAPVRQINQTVTIERGAVRGLHFQYPPHEEDKFVSCLSGEVFDVAVDIRCGSRTFLKYYGTRLSGTNFRSLMIPRGFAHGFQTLTENCTMLYLHSASYESRNGGALNVADPLLQIDWPLPITGLSERDATHPMITHEFCGIAV